MTVEIMEARGQNGERWATLVERLPAAYRDLHFLPQYGEIYRATYGFEPHLAYLERDGAIIMQPFVLRGLGSLPFVDPDTDERDIANPYGYGGPIGHGDPAAIKGLAPEFCEDLHRRLVEMGAASEFCSLHPFMHEHQRSIIAAAGMVATFEKDVCFVDTSRTEAAITSALSRGTRSKLARARRSGVEIAKVDVTPANLARFETLYRHTMDRNGAATRWYLPDGYFVNCTRMLGLDHTSLFFATIGGTLATAYFLIHAFDTAYYHFGASHEDYFEHRPNDLMLVETSLWAARSGYKRYYLGGGVTTSPDDPLLRFKSSVGRCRAPLYTYFCIHDRSAYNRLSALKRQHEIAEHGRESASEFLPAYRRPYIGEHHP